MHSHHAAYLVVSLGVAVSRVPLVVLGGSVIQPFSSFWIFLLGGIRAHVTTFISSVVSGLSPYEAEHSQVSSVILT